MRTVAPALVMLACVAANVACAGGAPAPAAASDASGPTVSFSLPSDSGDLVTVPLRNARITVLDFFGPTCKPCEKKVPALVSRRAEMEKRGARLVLVAVLADSETTADATKALATWGAPSAFLVDSGGVSLREAGVKDLPSTLALDEQGHLRWRAPVGATAEDVIAAVR